MDLAAHVISAGWASGVNAYLTVAMLSLLGRSGAVEVPDRLESDPILYGSLVLFAVEFVADKVPYVDNLWDAGQTIFRPAIGGALGVAFAGEAGVDNLDEVLSGGTAGGTAPSATRSRRVCAWGSTPRRAGLEHHRERHGGRPGGRDDGVPLVQPEIAAGDRAAAGVRDHPGRADLDPDPADADPVDEAPGDRAPPG